MIDNRDENPEGGQNERDRLSHGWAASQEQHQRHYAQALSENLDRPDRRIVLGKDLEKLFGAEGQIA
jgi:hypothetical protein